ncbi:MAG: thioesterase family protein [Deltaproteobacteria bacterium]|nr:thioesterase family protein [Deltaproteobacteria bacterium]
MNQEQLDILRRLTEEMITFNKTVGMKFVSAEHGTAQLKFDFKPELVGNFMLKVLHGGVISAALDMVGGLAIMTTLLDKGQINGMGTVDMRVDFLNPGRGDWFKATGTVMREGKVLWSSRMELHNDQDDLIAIGTGVYRVSMKKEEVFMTV